ncbi:MAG TPA: gamma-glutamyl-gamma-aminobutyrate hydrolase family protein [Candidatus Limnocylindria bacterium]|nr:gamma-glutamyl-gamma-aminobutyrate hydrolase family protein [Candidatus Limnocylindria bacterium]
MKKPKILISMSNVTSPSLEEIVGDVEILYSDRAAATAIIKAGGLPIYMPSLIDLSEDDLSRYINIADGVLIAGEDVGTNPAYYGEDVLDKAARLDDERDQTDIRLVKLAYQKKIPMLGLCKGMQIINVALGGTLYQDIASQYPGAINHDAKNSRTKFTHRATLKEESVLKSIFGGDKLRVNGGHRQGVKELSKQLTAVATASDGIVEAFEGSNYPFLLGVQFHPEIRLFDPQFMEIFNRFVSFAKSK